jgi:Transcriptional regulator, AbiEi antitoxin, Type IV TA system
LPQNPVLLEREAARRVPRLLSDLLDEERLQLERDRPLAPDDPTDLAFADSRGRRWAIEFKSSSRLGRIVDAAEQLRRYADEEAIPLLVVPYMSKAGAQAAEDAGVNWLDLAGNASIRAENLRVWVQGRPNPYRSRGRPSSPFAPRSARVTRVLLLDPSRWWRQKDLVGATGLDDGTVSRVVRRLDEERLLETHGREVRPRDPGLLLDAWAEDYRSDRHDVVAGHKSGMGIEVAREVAQRLTEEEVHHAFTGLSAAWAIDRFARFRLNTVYVEGNPRDAADVLGVRVSERGANLQIVGPDDVGVFAGERQWDDLNCVSPAQVYLDLLHLPERADEAARHLRATHLSSRAAA